MRKWGLGVLGRVLGVVVAAAMVCEGVVCGADRGADPAGERVPGAAEIDALFSEWGEGTPGMAVAVVRDERVVFVRGYGMANLDHSVPISGHTVFDIGSTSKQFTAACVLLLEEERKLALTDDVRKYIPELPRYDAVITIAHLMHHTSGLRDYTAVMSLGGLSMEPDYSEAFLLGVICRQKGLNFAPGERFSYSNTGYFLLGEIVRRVSGMPLARFAQERIFRPLGMDSTVFMDDHTAVIRHRAESYYPREDGTGRYVVSISLMDNVGDGGVYTTVEDLAKWDANFYGNRLGAGKPRFISRMLEEGVLSSGQPIGYASGLFIGSHRGEKMVFHSGGWRGFRAEMIRFPERRLSVICLANVGSAHPSAVARQVADLYLPAGGGGEEDAAGTSVAEPSAAPTVTIAEQEWGKFLGRYKAEAGPTWTLTRRGNELAVVSTTGLAFAARPVGALEFESTDRPQLARLMFERDGRGGIARITQKIAGTPDIRLEALGSVVDAAAGLSDFEGVFDSEEVGASMKATVSEGKLWFTGTGEPEPFPMNRFAPDGFSVWGFDAEFTRGRDGKVDGFIMNSPRAGGMRYVKRVGG